MLVPGSNIVSCHICHHFTGMDSEYVNIQSTVTGSMRKAEKDSCMEECDKNAEPDQICQFDQDKTGSKRKKCSHENQKVRNAKRRKVTDNEKGTQLKKTGPDHQDQNLPETKVVKKKERKRLESKQSTGKTRSPQKDVDKGKTEQQCEIGRVKKAARKRNQTEENIGKKKRKLIQHLQNEVEEKEINLKGTADDTMLTKPVRNKVTNEKKKKGKIEPKERSFLGQTSATNTQSDCSESDYNPYNEEKLSKAHAWLKQEIVRGGLLYLGPKLLRGLQDDYDVMPNVWEGDGQFEINQNDFPMPGHHLFFDNINRYQDTDLSHDQMDADFDNSATLQCNMQVKPSGATKDCQNKQTSNLPHATSDHSSNTTSTRMEIHHNLQGTKTEAWQNNETKELASNDKESFNKNEVCIVGDLGERLIKMPPGINIIKEGDPVVRSKISNLLKDVNSEQHREIVCNSNSDICQSEPIVDGSYEGAEIPRHQSHVKDTDIAGCSVAEASTVLESTAHCPPEDFSLSEGSQSSQCNVLISSKQSSGVKNCESVFNKPRQSIEKEITFWKTNTDMLWKMKKTKLEIESAELCYANGEKTAMADLIMGISQSDIDRFDTSMAEQLRIKWQNKYGDYFPYHNQLSELEAMNLEGCQNIVRNFSSVPSFLGELKKKYRDTSQHYAQLMKPSVNKKVKQKKKNLKNQTLPSKGNQETVGSKKSSKVTKGEKNHKRLLSKSEPHKVSTKEILFWERLQKLGDDITSATKNFRRKSIRLSKNESDRFVYLKQQHSHLEALAEKLKVERKESSDFGYSVYRPETENMSKKQKKKCVKDLKCIDKRFWKFKRLFLKQMKESGLDHVFGQN